MAEIISGEVVVSSGTTKTGLYVIQGGTLKILDEGFAKDVDLIEGGKAEVYEEGILYICTVSSGGTATVFDGGFAQDVTVKYGGLYLVSGGTMHKSVISSGGTQIVRPDENADLTVAGAVVMNGGVLHVSDGGYVIGLVISSGGMLHVSGGGLANRVEVAGTFVLNPDAVVRDVQVLSGGTLSVLPEGFAYMLEIGSGGRLEVASDGFVSSAVVSGGEAVIFAGGSAFNLKINGGHVLLESSDLLENNAFASGVTVESGGTLVVSDGAVAVGIKENGGFVELAEEADVVFASNTFSGLALSNASATVHSGTTAQNVTVDPGGALHIGSGGVAVGIVENGGYVDFMDGANVSFSSSIISGQSLADASATVHSGTTATDVTVLSGGRMEVFSGGRLTGVQTFESGAVVSMCEDAVLDFDVSGLTQGAAPLVNDLSIVQGAPVYTLTVSASQPDGVYTLAEGAAGFDGTIAVRDTLGESFGTFTAGDSLKIGDADCKLNLNDSVLTFVVQTVGPVPENLVGTKDRVSWGPAGENGYVVEYSTNDFGSVLSVETSATTVDMLALPAGTYQWRVKAKDGEEWAVGDAIVSDNDNVPKILQSTANGNDDLFFAQASGVWENIFYAQHVGSVNDWSGTKEIISARGKNRLANLFFGSDDSNVLCLTDDENGDGLFVDDEYTELPEGITEQKARIAQIDEIRAGAGDDIVDMTSQRLEYIGDGLIIRGGEGNDTIWSNKGSNMLFGDAGKDRIVGASGNDVIAGGIGNDRMHGGGGNDVFTFCDNWGVDNVEQLAGGEVVLWFAEGSLENWDASSLTYTDGTNSVKVSGVAAENVTLRFGDDGSAQFASLTSMGAFFDATSERIFEESGKGILASL